MVPASGYACSANPTYGCGTRFAQTVLAPTDVSGLGRSHARRDFLKPSVALQMWIHLPAYAGM